MSDVKAEADLTAEKKSVDEKSAVEKSVEKKSVEEISSSTKIIAAPLDASRFDAKRVAVQMMVGNQFIRIFTRLLKNLMCLLPYLSIHKLFPPGKMP